jgi:hypothetical protein
MAFADALITKRPQIWKLFKWVALTLWLPFIAGAIGLVITTGFVQLSRPWQLSVCTLVILLVVVTWQVTMIRKFRRTVFEYYLLRQEIQHLAAEYTLVDDKWYGWIYDREHIRIIFEELYKGHLSPKRQAALLREHDQTLYRLRELGDIAITRRQSIIHDVTELISKLDLLESKTPSLTNLGLHKHRSILFTIIFKIFPNFLYSRN